MVRNFKAHNLIQNVKTMSQGSLAKNYCFTLNNFTDADTTSISDFFPRLATYVIFGREVGESGTPHLQGYIQFTEKKRLTALKKLLPTAHWEVARGTPEENKTYCSKDGHVTEHGSMVSQGQRSDLQSLVALIDTGASRKRIADEMPEMVIKYSRGIATLQAWRLQKRDFKTEVHWFYGPTGCGKSHTAAGLAPEAYYKPAGDKWWNDYCGESDVIIEDMRKDFCTFSEMLRLFDKYPMYVETKGGTMPFVSRRIYVTTPKDPEAFWEGRTEEDLQQLLRRITSIRYFGDRYIE